ncbi:MAG: NAD-dependent dehydratase [Phycisphaerae bacterium SM23_33]|nr:MAG: NAD-dependent dehydratase [Planctomycetes bacterium DG_20]KPK86854.1 MAG: NAD-dependent dehydratase [Phycisphaerae bacterium SM23_33]
MDWRGKNVVVTGGAGFLGSHLCDRLKAEGCEPFVPRSARYDLRYPSGVSEMFLDAGPVDVLFHLAAVVGGIGLNKESPGTLFYENAVMGIQLVEQARLNGVEKFVQVGTVCAYPRAEYKQREEALWSGYPDPTNAPYGLAKKMLLVQLQAYREQYGMNGIYLLPTNLYGPRDNFDLETSHVVPALVRKCVEARERGEDHIVVWGTGKPSRDFLYVEDAAEGLVLAAERYDRPEPLNLGSGQEVRIDALVHYVQGATGFEGGVKWDTSRPDGQPRRVLDSSRAKAAIGWEARTPLLEGLRKTVQWYGEHR